jgi:hypothetical protein
LVLQAHLHLDDGDDLTISPGAGESQRRHDASRNARARRPKPGRHPK